MAKNSGFRAGILSSVVLAAITLAGCGSTEGPAAKPRTESTIVPGEQGESSVQERATTVVGGYPLDRSLDGLVNMKDVDTVVVVKSTKFGDPVFVGSDGPDGTGGRDFIVTPLNASIQSSLRGNQVAGADIAMIIGGGAIGDLEVVAEREIAPRREDIDKYSRLVVAGQMKDIDGVGRVLDPYFVYGVNGEGKLKSLMASAGEAGEFSLEDLRSALAR
jgi:hypothetical protein